MKIRLHISDSVQGQEPRVFDLEFARGDILIGRDVECEICIPSKEVSRRHARITKDSNVWYVQDLGSSFGTTLNGMRLDGIEKHPLSSGDQIEIIHAQITVDLNGEEAEEAFDEKTSIVAQKMVRELVERPESTQPHLLVMNGRNEGMKMPLHSQSQEFVIGRDKSADLCIADESLSRQHARIRREWRELILEDMSSKNGVVVNGRRLSSQLRLKDGDEIFLGSVHLTFFDPSYEEEEPNPATYDDPLNEQSQVDVSAVETATLPRLIAWPEIVIAALACGVLVALIVALNLWRG